MTSNSNGHLPNGHNGLNGRVALADDAPPIVFEDLSTPGAATAAAAATWSVSETLRGKRILITGTTGFLAKVYLSMVLKFHPDVAQVYLLIRGRRDQTAEERFFDLVAPSGAMLPLQETYGAGYLDFLREKVTVLAGDVCEPYLGLGEARAREVSSELDVFVNSAGLTNFNPNLRNALEINTLSLRHVLDFIRLGGRRASLLHVSTTYVAGNVQKPSPECAPGPTLYPNYDELGVDYDHEREIEDCLQLIAHTEQLARDQKHHSRFVRETRDRLAKKNLDPNDATLFERELERVRDQWTARTLSMAGRERAAHWGWPNIYTYTKSLGERLLTAAADEINLTIVRPAIIESAVSYPQVGWNEGINTTAPLCFLIYKGHRFIPTREGVNLDVIPVDYVSGGMVAVTAGLLERRHHAVYQLGSSDLNPVSVERLVELSQLGARRLVNREVKTPTWKKTVLNAMDSVAVDKTTFERRSIPGIKRAVGGLKGLIDGLPTRQMGGVGKALDAVKKSAGQVEQLTGALEKVFELFLPFTYDNKYTFRARHIGELVAELPESERLRYGSPVATLDWRDYWLEIHMPGLYRHAFDELDAKFKEKSVETYTYEDLVALFDSSTHNFANRVALQHHAGGIVERYTYAELKERAERAAHFLRGAGVTTGRPVLLVGENRPQWGMAYFGVLKAGGITVPVDATSTVDQVINVAKSCHAHTIIVSPAVAERLGDELGGALTQAGLPTRVVTFDQLFTLALPAATDAAAAAESQPAAASADLVAADDPVHQALVASSQAGQPLASLIYTSGTTGNPKGVMLTHRNFTSLLASLQQTFRINERDGFLSVLPLHHTFEFTAGFLMPLSRGSAITYLEELSADELNSALTSTRVTALIGVPALWQLLHRRIDQRLGDAPPAVRWVFDNLLELNKTLRERLGVNVGPTLFGVVHRGFGGRIKYFISGGAALPANILKTFYGLGFNMYEGYGLTEAAPVLTVNRPEQGFAPGSVGRALPGIEVAIKDPNDEGVGEVIARGPNVMLGYLGREEDTAKALADGWLHTGDLGKIDEKGRLSIVGREKELIVTSGGKNVYPDELEDLYGKCPDVLELSVVGLPDGNGAERVACLVRPDLPKGASAQEIAETRAAIREWIRVEGARGASHNRIQVLRFFDEEFPRTSTRKIKRSGVVQILERLIAAEAEAAKDADVEDTTWAWLDKAIGTLADYDPARIHNATHFLDELGFDSLMFIELASILEARGYHVAQDHIGQIQTVGELQDLLAGNNPAASTALVTAPKSTLERVEEIPIHPAVAKITRNALYIGQMKAYENLFDVEVFGRAHIPYHDQNIIVVANHSSHLDMGLVKYALGEYGSEIRALAAADYFFKNTARKTFFNNFTNLLPVERSGSLEQSLGNAVDALRRGEMLLMFPEGTRATDGKLRPFRRGLGYLVDSQVVDVLPMYIEGTHRALPKGQKLPSPTARKLKVYIGPVLRAHDLRRECQGMSPTERFDHISKRAQAAVEALRDGARGGQSRADQDLSPLFEGLNHKFERNQVDSPVHYYFTLGAFDHHKWTVSVDPDSVTIHQGKPRGGQADCVVKTSPEIFRKIVEESYVPGLDEFMSGVIKTNDPDLLMRFGSVFRL